MRTRRKLTLLLAVTIVLPGVALTWWLTRPRPVLSREAHDRIQRGMTLTEVEAIIGAPPGNYGGENLNDYDINSCQGWICALFRDWRYGKPSIPLGVINAKLAEGRVVVWTGPRYAIAVQLDGEDRVVATGHGISERPESLWQRLLETMGIR